MNEHDIKFNVIALDFADDLAEDENEDGNESDSDSDHGPKPNENKAKLMKKCTENQ